VLAGLQAVTMSQVSMSQVSMMARSLVFTAFSVLRGFTVVFCSGIKVLGRFLMVLMYLVLIAHISLRSATLLNLGED
jgi:hypothetical protein